MTDQAKLLQNIQEMDAEAERILNMPEAELYAEIIAEGGNPEEYARSARNVINATLAAHKLWCELMIANVEGGDLAAKLHLCKFIRTERNTHEALKASHEKLQEVVAMTIRTITEKMELTDPISGLHLLPELKAALQTAKDV